MYGINLHNQMNTAQVIAKGIDPVRYHLYSRMQSLAKDRNTFVNDKNVQGTANR